MISKELFVESMNELKKSWDMAVELNKIFHDYDRRDFLDGFGFCEDGIQDCLIKVIADSFGKDCAEILNWWCWECAFGENNPHIYLGEQEEPFITLDTPEQLYDFITNNKNIKQYNKILIDRCHIF